jgi:poly(A) polymerase
MLRAARFAGKLAFTLHPESEAPVYSLSYMLDSVPPARLFDETMKLMLAGRGMPSFELLFRLDLLEHLMPDVDLALREQPQSTGARLLRLGVEATDERINSDRTVTPSILFAVLLWPAILREAGAVDGPLPADPQLAMAACDAVLARQVRRLAIPKRFSLPMRELVAMQSRFERRAGRRALRLLDHPRFRPAYDFLCLRAAAGEIDSALAEWWTRIQDMSGDARLAEVERQPGEPVPSRRRRRPRRRRQPAA